MLGCTLPMATGLGLATMKLGIRKATLTDVPRLWELRRRSILELAPRGMSVAQSEAWADGRTIQGMEGQFREIEIWTAEINDTIVGWVGFHADYLDGLYTDPKFIEQGIGTQLLAVAEGLMRERGMRAIRADASWNAEEFYLRRGYEPTAPRPADGARPLVKQLVPARAFCESGKEIELREEPMAALAEHARISIAFEVDRILALSVDKGGSGAFVLTERKLDTPYVKDYDAINGGGPTDWAKQFDTSNWALISAHIGGQRVGGVVIAFNTPGMDMLEGRNDLAVLWDLRVAPEFRGKGTGCALFRAAEHWAVGRGCRQLKIETQNINSAACRFYARQGCVLGAMNRFAYKELPEETQMLWYKDLTTVAGPDEIGLLMADPKPISLKSASRNVARESPQSGMLHCQRNRL